MLPRYQKITRRDFLKISFTAGGALLVGSFLDACASPTSTPTATQSPTFVPTSTSTPVSETPFQPNIYIRIENDGRITLSIHRSEMGQGVRTSLAMILAEELEADWSTIRVEQMDATDKANQVTSGSGSIIGNYVPLRAAGARARQILVAAAAQIWGISPKECKAENGLVKNSLSGEKLGYGELVRVAQDLKLTNITVLKDPKDVGSTIERVNFNKSRDKSR